MRCYLFFDKENKLLLPLLAASISQMNFIYSDRHSLDVIFLKNWGNLFWVWGKSHLIKNLITQKNAPLRLRNDVTHAHSIWNCMNEWTRSRFEVVLASYGRNKNLDNEIQKHSRTSPDVQFKEISLTKEKTRPKTDYKWIGKTIQKKNPIQKTEITVKIKMKLPHVNKNH